MSISAPDFPTFETIVYRTSGEVEVYYEHGDTPQRLAILQERLQRHPTGRQKLYQHGDGALRETPPPVNGSVSV